MAHKIDWPVFAACFGARELPNPTCVLSDNPKDLAALLALAKTFRPKRVLEIGVHYGRTAKAIMVELEDVAAYIGLDVPPGYRTIFPSQQGEVPVNAAADCLGRKEFALLLGDSLTIRPAQIGEIDLALIDGSHDVAHVGGDTALAVLCRARVIVWHDYGIYPDVTDFIDDCRPNAVVIGGTGLAFEVIR